MSPSQFTHLDPVYKGKEEGQTHFSVTRSFTIFDDFGHGKHALATASKYPSHGRHWPWDNNGLE